VLTTALLIFGRGVRFPDVCAPVLSESRTRRGRYACQGKVKRA
jgi:hypothetical protein